MTEMKNLTKEQILGAEDLPIETVEVPEWCGAVRVRTLTGKERDALEESVIGPGGVKSYVNLRARLVSYAIVNEDGSLMFSTDDIEKLGEKSARALDRVFAVAQRLSGITKKDVEELTVNLSGDPSEGSTSG
jgi:hypothetical protein